MHNNSKIKQGRSVGLRPVGRLLVAAALILAFNPGTAWGQTVTVTNSSSEVFNFWSLQGAIDSTDTFQGATIQMLSLDAPYSYSGSKWITGATFNIGYGGVDLDLDFWSANMFNQNKISVDMTGAVLDQYILVRSDSLCTFGTYKFAEGKSNGYSLKIEKIYEKISGIKKCTAKVMKAVKTSYIVTVGEKGYATIYTLANVSIPEGVTVLDYTYDADDKSFVLKHSYTSGVIEGGKGYVISAAPGTYSFPSSTAQPQACESCLKGCQADTESSTLGLDPVYVFDVIDGVGGFYNYADTLKAGKAYFQLKNE